MFDIDDLRKLAKMMEVLLNRTQDNKEINLEKYVDIVKQIDSDSFEKLFTLLKQFQYRNLTLEEELEFLEKVSSSYQQMLEQQIGFKNVYKLYSDEELQLSNLEQVNIDYIIDRISNISGYLINKRNIEFNQNNLSELNKRLVAEEIEKNNLNKRLLDFEEILRDSFICAEGRCINNGKLDYVSVLSEYDIIGIDFKDLLYNEKNLKERLSLINSEKIENDEKLKIAEICFDNSPSVDNGQILEDIKNENLKLRYKLTLLKIIELLARNCGEYEDFKEKREKLLDLIKYRLNCINSLGLSISIDPFGRTKVFEQLEILDSFRDNSKDIYRIKKEIANLDQRLDEMINKDKKFSANLSVIEDLIINKMSINDVDISSVILPVDEEIVERVIEKNQVIGIKQIPEQFNFSIVEQKVNSVIERVNEMINVPLINDEKNEVLSPDLIIVSSRDIELDDISTMENSSLDDVDSVKIDNDEENIEKETLIEEELIEEKQFDDDIFKDVVPFLETPLFTDKADIDDIMENVLVIKEETKNEDNIDDEKMLVRDNEVSEQMPDAFWITQSDDESMLVENNDEFQLSFDEQIDVLLSDDDYNTKNRKMR